MAANNYFLDLNARIVTIANTIVIKYINIPLLPQALVYIKLKATYYRHEDTNRPKLYMCSPPSLSEYTDIPL